MISVTVHLPDKETLMDWYGDGTQPDVDAVADKSSVVFTYFFDGYDGSAQTVAEVHIADPPTIEIFYISLAGFTEEASLSALEKAYKEAMKLYRYALQVTPEDWYNYLCEVAGTGTAVSFKELKKKLKELSKKWEKLNGESFSDLVGDL